MKKIIFCLFFILILPVCTNAQENSDILMVLVKYDSGNLSIGDALVKKGAIQDLENQETMGPLRYWIKLINFQGAILEERMFSIDNIVYFEPPKEGEEVLPGQTGQQELMQTERYVTLPYHKDVKMVMVFDANRNLLDQKDIGYLAQLCPDGVCEEGESYGSCPDDCPPAGKDGYCNQEMMANDPDCPKNIKSDQSINNVDSKDKSNAKWWIIFILMLVFASVLAGWLYKRKKNSNIE